MPPATGSKPKYKVVAFDLDGTLANTASLSAGYRRPSLVLTSCRTGDPTDEITFSSQVARLPSRVMLNGAIVAVITRSPFAYASTLCYLLGIDYNVLLTSRDGNGVAARLERLIAGAQIEPHELLYIGDREADEQAAAEVGADFLYPPWGGDDPVETDPLPGCAGRVPFLHDSGHPAYTHGSLLQTLRKSARTGGSLSAKAFQGLRDADLDEQLRSAITWMLLRSAPAQQYRRDLQQLAFATVPASAYDCVIPKREGYGLVGLSRTIMTRSEYETNANKRSELLRLFAQLHPSHTITTSRVTVDHPGLGVYAFRRFKDSRGGELLRAAKDWGGHGKGQSRDNVILSLLELPTLAIASRLATNPGGPAIVPAPASPWTKSKPGQVSERIAMEAARLGGREVLRILSKSDGGIDCSMPGDGRDVTIIDDQLTTGDTTSRCVDALKTAGYDVRAVVTWSASTRHMTGAPTTVAKCWLADAVWLLGRDGACGPTHRTAPSSEAREVAALLDGIVL